MSTAPDVTWQHRDRPWWVKLRRAGVHIREAAAGVEEFNRTEPWTVEPEPGDEPLVVAHRFRVHREPPTDLLAVIGDAVHSLRLALDAMAYGIATLHTGPLSPGQEEATAFPICETVEKFTAHMARRVTKGRPVTLADLYGPNGVAALRCVQPFALPDEARAFGVDVAHTPDEDLKADAAYRLNVLWNVDKHRRLPALVWFYAMMFHPAAPVTWQWIHPQRDRIADDMVLGRHRFDSTDEVRPFSPTWEVALTLADDPSPYTNDLVAFLVQCHTHVGAWLVPRAFYVATTGNPPPMGIGRGWPYTIGS